MGFFKLKRRFLSRKIEIKNRVKKIKKLKNKRFRVKKL